MAPQRRTKPVGEKSESVAKTLGKLGHGEGFCLRGHQLQCERHATESPADFDRECRLAICQRKPTNGLGDAFNKQFNRRKCEGVARTNIASRFGVTEWR